MLANSVAGCLLLATSVLAHGNVRHWTIEGVRYDTYLPYAYPDFSAPPVGIARYLGNGINPLEDVTSTAMACNVNSYPAPLMAPVKAGSTITATWNEWPHRGPIYTYMAKCPNGKDCSDFNGTSGAHWFKIEEHGVIPYPSSPAGVDWATQKMFDNDNQWDVKIPKCLKNGPYLIRHETVALQSAYKVGGAQFYPQCAQVLVSGGTGTLSPKLVKLPGDIKADQPGVLWPRYQVMGTFNYTCPGSRPVVCPA